MNAVTEDQIIAAIIGAVIGLVIGYLLGGRMAPGSQQTRELEDELQAAKGKLENYEQQVTTHFADTAAKLNALTENYRDVYSHIASGAAELCSNDGGPDFNALAAPQTDGPETIEADSVVVEPPRDYAPKSSPEEPGVLNERFGLDGEDVPPEDSSTRTA